MTTRPSDTAIAPYIGRDGSIADSAAIEHCEASLPVVKRHNVLDPQPRRDGDIVLSGIDDEDIGPLHDGSLTPCEPLHFFGGSHLNENGPGAGGGSGIRDIYAVCYCAFPRGSKGLYLSECVVESGQKQAT